MKMKEARATVDRIILFESKLEDEEEGVRCRLETMCAEVIGG